MPTKDTFASQQPFQDNTIDTQDTGQQAALQRSDISTIHTVKHPATPMPAIPATPMPLISPTPVPQSDLEQDAHIYSHSAKLNAFSPQQQRNASGQIGYSTPQQQGSQSNIPQQQLNNGVQISYAPVQQQFSPPVTRPATHNPGLSYILAVCVGLTALPLPYIAHLLIDLAFPMRDGALVFWLFALVLGLLLLQTVLQFITRAATGSLQRTHATVSIMALYERVLRSPRQKNGTQHTLDRLNAVTTARESVIQTGGSFATAVIMAFIFAATLFLVDWRLAGATVLVALIYLGIGSVLSRRYRRASLQVQESYSRVNAVLSQGLAAMQTQTTVPFLEHTVQTTLNEAAQHSYQHTFERSSINLISGVIRGIGGIALLGLGGYLLLTHAITTGQLAAFVLLLLILSTPLAALTTLMQQGQAVSAAEERVTEIFK